MRPTFGRLAALREIELAAYFVNKQALFSTVLLQPIVYFLLLAGGLKSVVQLGGQYSEVGYLRFVLPGLLAMQAMRTMDHVVYRTTIDRRWGLLAFKRLAGAGSFGYITAMLIAPLGSLLLQSSILLALAMIMGTSYNALYLIAGLAIAALCVVFWSMVGVALTILFKNYQQRDSVLLLLTLPMIFSAPVFYPLDSAQSYIRAISYVNPLAYQVEAVRRMFVGGEFSWELGILAFATFALVLVAVHSLKHGDMMRVGER